MDDVERRTIRRALPGELRSRTGQDGEALGIVVSVENFGAGDLLEVETPNGKRSLIPFREPIARLEAERVILDPEFLA